jgi:hypothetical protein
MHRLIIATCLAAAACTPEGDFTVRLVTAGFDRPFDGIDRFEVQVLDSGLNKVAQVDAPSEPTQIDFGNISSFGTARLVVSGVTGGTVSSIGHTRQLPFQSGQATEELVPFGKLDVAVALPFSSVATTEGGGIDGILSDWRGSPSMVLDNSHRRSGPEVTPKDLRVELYLGWVDQQLRFAIRVIDDCVSLKLGSTQSDCDAPPDVDYLAFGIDGNKSGGDDYDSADFWVQVRDGVVKAIVNPAGQVNKDTLKTGLAYTEEGWALEGSIPIVLTGNQAFGATTRLGFDLVVVDNDPIQLAPTVLSWSGRWSGVVPTIDPEISATRPENMGSIGFATSP